MFTSWKSAALVVVVVVVVGSMSSVALADHQRYEMKRIHAGPRADQYVYVRTDRFEQRERPYALTGSDREARASERPMPLHLKGPRGNY